MTEKNQKIWYLGLLTSLSGSLLVACGVQSVNAIDGSRKILWTLFYILSGTLFFGLSQKTGKIMNISIEYIRGFQVAEVIIIFAGLGTIFLTNAINYEFLTISQIAMSELDTYSSIAVAIGTFLLAIFTGYQALQTKKAVQSDLTIKCRELHTFELRNVIQELIDTLPQITSPEKIISSSSKSINNISVKSNAVLVMDLKNHLPKGQSELFEKKQKYEEKREKYIKSALELFNTILNEVTNKTTLVYDRGFGKNGSFSESFVDTLYINAFYIAEGKDPYYDKLDYKENEDEVWLKEYGLGLIKTNDPIQKQKGKEVYEFMKSELKNSTYIQEAKKLLDKEQELNAIRETILDDLNNIIIIPILPGICKYIKSAMS